MYLCTQQLLQHSTGLLHSASGNPPPWIVQLNIDYVSKELPTVVHSRFPSEEPTFVSARKLFGGMSPPSSMTATDEAMMNMIHNGVATRTNDSTMTTRHGRSKRRPVRTATSQS